MPLQEKYQALITAAKAAGVQNLKVREQNNVLHVEGTTQSNEVKDKLWAIYNQIDPDYRAGDLILNIDASASAGTSAKVITESSNLNIRRAPDTDAEIVGKAAHGEIVIVVSTTNEQWSFVRTEKGVEGYVYSQYLAQA